jgi:hypothetical protein
MKIGLLLSGNPRTYKETIKALNLNLCNNNDVDIFIHSWETQDSNTKSWWRNKIKSKIIKEKELIKLYKPKRILLESPKPFTSTYAKSDTFIYNLFSMQYGVFKACELLISYSELNNINYDIIIRCRFDLFLQNKIDKNELIDATQNNFIYVPGSETYKSIFGISDVFAFGNFKLMKEYCSFYNELDNVFNNSMNTSKIVIPEFLLHNYLISKNINHKNTKNKVSIMRSKSNLLRINFPFSENDNNYPYFLFDNNDFLNNSTIANEIRLYNNRFINLHQIQDLIHLNELINNTKLFKDTISINFNHFFKSSKSFFCIRFCSEFRIMIIKTYKHKFGKFYFFKLILEKWFLFFLVKYLFLKIHERIYNLYLYQMITFKYHIENK